MEQPAWLAAAWAEVGVREIKGSKHDARVMAYYRESGHAQIGNDEVPWCAAFMGAMLKRGGCEGSGSLMARSYLKWGVPLQDAKLGAVAVLSRGADPALGHVGFVVGAAKGKIYLLGGNQFDSVSIAAFDAKKVLGLRWPAPQQAPVQDLSAQDAGADEPAREAAQSDDVFARALAHVLDMEGGFSDDPHDPGGPTNKGITLAVYARFKGVTVEGTSRGRLVDALKRIPDDTVRAIYRQRYWLPARCAAMPPALALFHFDAAVNHGVAGAARLLQRALGVASDGEIGPQTRAAIKAARTADLIDAYAEVRRARYRALPHFWRFGRGWLARVDASRAKALALENDTQADDTQNEKGGSDMAQDLAQDTATADTGKWWAQSKTIWGALITAAAGVVPLLGPLLGVELSPETITQAGDQTLAAVQAATALIGTLLTIFGRLKAQGPLTRRSVSVRL
jgi:uncharacterized protein (TIGR02594 family)